MAGRCLRRTLCRVPQAPNVRSLAARSLEAAFMVGRSPRPRRMREVWKTPANSKTCRTESWFMIAQGSGLRMLVVTPAIDGALWGCFPRTRPGDGALASRRINSRGCHWMASNVAVWHFPPTPHQSVSQTPRYCDTRLRRQRSAEKMEG